MIAAWMLSAVLVGVLATAGAMAADRLFVALRKQTRFVWLGAMGLTLGWPVLAYVRARIAAGSAAPEAPLRSSVQQLTAIVVRASETSLHVRADVVLIIAWSLLSAVLLARMFVALRSLRASGRGWRSQQVDGVHVRLSRDVGPAVVGFDPMEVVLPEWALELEPSLRTLVLAHEEEHRRARDPYLLLLSAALIVLVPWNPALWVQARRLRLAIEMDCDARVLRSHPRPERYGLLLLAIAQRRSSGMSLLAPALSEPTSNLERRINAMNNPLKNESRVRLAVLGGIAVVLVAVACAIDAPVSPSPRAEVRASANVPAEPEAARQQLLKERIDSEIGWAMTKARPDGKGVISAWVRDSSGKKSLVTVRYDSSGEGAREERLLKARAEFKQGGGEVSREVPVVEQGVVAPKRDGSGIAMELIAPTRVDDTTAFNEYRVEQAAKWIAGTGAPVYPPELKSAGIEGEVVASFVVDGDGRVDMGTLKIVRSTNDRFANAIRTAVPSMRFTPAQVGGRAVRQVVQQSFVFSVK